MPTIHFMNEAGEKVFSQDVSALMIDQIDDFLVQHGGKRTDTHPRAPKAADQVPLSSFD